MIGIVKRVFEPAALVQMRRKAERDPTPRSTIELCRQLIRHGRREEALDQSRSGLKRWPRCVELRDLVHSASRHGSLDPRSHHQDLGEDATLGDWSLLFERLRDSEELEAAIELLPRFLDHFSSIVEARVIAAELHAKRFQRDHMRDDGEAAIAHLEAAIALAPSDLAPRMALARLLLYIGAPGRAMLHLYAAREASPDDLSVQSEISRTQELPLETQDIAELLRGVEDRDGPHAFGSANAIETPAARREGWLQRLSLLEGVRRVALVEGEGATVATDGFLRPVAAPRELSFITLARGFHRTALGSAKRMGIGTLHEASLNWDGGGVFAVAAGQLMLFIELAGGSASEELVAAAHDLVASLTGSLTHA